MLRAALATPLRSDDAAGTLVIGTFLTLLGSAITVGMAAGALAVPVVTPLLVVAAPVVLAPAFVARGYHLRVVAEGIEATTGGAPPFIGWGELYRDGIRSVLLSVAYLLPLAVGLAGVAVAGVFVELGRVDPASAVAPVSAPAPAAGALGGFVAVASLAYLVAFAYLRPAALAVFAATGRLRDAFRPTAVGRVAFSGSYAVAWALAAVTLLTGYVLATPLAPLLVGFGVIFVARVAAHVLYGRGASGAIARAVSSGALDDAIDPAPEQVPGDPARRSDRPTHTEASPNVQTGRSVPVERAGPETNDGIVRGRSAEGAADADADVDADAADADPADTDEFEWGP
ncbi:MAG: protein of unknown function (DUF4013) [uncultured archaeon A07HR67]|nr:MAG: protein of unknown function (DUF4013) [uncultured archaeon A07HR67]